MVVREIEKKDFPQLFELYTHLHEKEVPESCRELDELTEEILNDRDYHIIVCDDGGKIVSSVSCIVIKNLTHHYRPYALVENVVTHEDFRNKGYATACLDYAYELARKNNCYKIFLMTGSKLESTLDFYRRAGFDDKGKTAFVRWME